MQSYETLADCYDTLMDDVDYDAWGDYLVSLLQAHGILPGTQVLDAACGTGALTLQLHRAGYRVTGLDISEAMLAVAAQRLRKAGCRCPLVCRDMRRFVLHHPVNAICCACDGVNYLTDDASVSSFFTAAYQNLCDGGVLLFDISAAQKLRNMDGQFYAEDRGDVAYIWNNAMRDGVLEMELAFFMRRDDGLYVRSDEIHRQKAHEAAHLQTLLLQTGFSDVRAFGFGTQRAPETGDSRIQFVAVRDTNAKNREKESEI
jgi:predicted TPR repeat methyltransferase